MLLARFGVARAAHVRIQRAILGVCEKRGGDGGDNFTNAAANREARLVLWALHDSAARIVQEEMRYYARFRMAMKKHQPQCRWPTTAKSTCGSTRGDGAVSSLATYSTELPDNSAVGDGFANQADIGRVSNINSSSYWGLRYFKVGPVNAEDRSELADRGANISTLATPETCLNTTFYTSSATRNTASDTVSNTTSRGTGTATNSPLSEPGRSSPYPAGVPLRMPGAPSLLWQDDGIAQRVPAGGIGDDVTEEQTPVGLDSGGNNRWSAWRQATGSNDMGVERYEESRHYSIGSKRQCSNNLTGKYSMFGDGVAGGYRWSKEFGRRNSRSEKIGAGCGRHSMLLPSEKKKKRQAISRELVSSFMLSAKGRDY